MQDSDWIKRAASSLIGCSVPKGAQYPAGTGSQQACTAVMTGHSQTVTGSDFGRSTSWLLPNLLRITTTTTLRICCDWNSRSVMGSCETLTTHGLQLQSRALARSYHFGELVTLSPFHLFQPPPGPGLLDSLLPSLESRLFGATGLPHQPGCATSRQPHSHTSC